MPISENRALKQNKMNGMTLQLKRYSISSCREEVEGATKSGRRDRERYSYVLEKVPQMFSVGLEFTIIVMKMTGCSPGDKVWVPLSPQRRPKFVYQPVDHFGVLPKGNLPFSSQTKHGSGCRVQRILWYDGESDAYLTGHVR